MRMKSCRPTFLAIFIVNVLVLVAMDQVESFSIDARKGVSLHHQQQQHNLLISRLAVGPLQSRDREDEEDLVKVPRRRRQRDYYEEEEEEEEDYYESESLYDDDEDEDEDDDDDDDWEEDDEDKDLFENAIIPNSLLDSMDPDGAADRFPELARDPRFWVDICLFIALYVSVHSLFLIEQAADHTLSLVSH
jgi:hypothetical protein